MNDFGPKAFFDLSDFKFKNIFDNTENVWDALKNLNFSQNQIGEGTVISQSVVNEGILITGKNCFISHAVYIRGIVILGDNVNIGHASELKNAVILNNSSVAHLNYIGDSIIGGNVNFGGGAITANLRFDSQKINIKTDSGEVETGLEKMGAILGDGVKIGANAVLNPGTVIGKNSVIFPLVSVSGYHPEGSKIK